MTTVPTDPRAALEGPAPAHASRFSRRQLLRGTLWTSATMASGGLLYRACFGSGAPGRGLLALTKGEYLTASAAAEAYFPSPEYVVSAEEARVGDFLDRYIHDMPRAKARLFKLLLRSLEYSPALTIQSLTRFSRLSLADRRRVLASWEQSRLFTQRTAHRALLFACASGYFEDEAVLAQMGWGVGCIVGPRAPGELL
ncbi:MAG: gluconate 2-dehydrogenase subunit 3 family protein [Deltaproteobacteria bacterium]